MTASQFRKRLCATLLLAGLCGHARADQGEFGSSESGGAALIGIFYDFKQTQKRQPTGFTSNDYPPLMEKFLTSGWDETLLNPYFRSTRSLYTTQIFIPVMGADNAPRAFDLQAIVKPSFWVAHYKGQVSPPEDGTYRFVGYGDDILAVGVDEKTVLVGAWFKVTWWQPPTPPVIKAGNGRLSFGDWITLKKDQVIDLDVLIGERPGNEFCAFLLYEKQGAAYPTNAKGEPMLPIFQLAPHQMPTYPPNLAPSFSTPTLLWRGHQ